jgi:hypothetical protein
MPPHLKLRRLRAPEVNGMSNVRFWHKADITIVMNDVRFWG